MSIHDLTYFLCNKKLLFHYKGERMEKNMSVQKMEAYLLRHYPDFTWDVSGEDGLVVRIVSGPVHPFYSFDFLSRSQKAALEKMAEGSGMSAEEYYNKDPGNDEITKKLRGKQKNETVSLVKKDVFRYGSMLAKEAGCSFSFPNDAYPVQKCEIVLTPDSFLAVLGLDAMNALDFLDRAARILEFQQAKDTAWFLSSKLFSAGFHREGAVWTQNGKSMLNEKDIARIAKSAGEKLKKDLKLQRAELSVVELIQLQRLMTHAQEVLGDAITGNASLDQMTAALSLIAKDGARIGWKKAADLASSAKDLSADEILTLSQKVYYTINGEVSEKTRSLAHNTRRKSRKGFAI